ncbi:DUF2956 domain-containing protein [Photobacterium sp. WH77]|uniref:DUF2956 domain-containing protein n=1 Tax=Photobacterium arenosum TaxID=2774143 RepID=A0ABR9BGY1_9GAMM|nr:MULTISPECIES: DUF2956 domain-containing protein [Photobacterium]MBD8511810.1 DUF2956 domain-containing protein [Photobacterium arenosum]MBV7261486.1 DUF2956 domain-containing protein [Photobacterium sp. WH24]MCG2836885.1 DUF2956 domain-containing protein [Photobacterium sp. WH77]MCG2844506.1 DUF2956 domain-containing protein [Photobacterium sp. WH80]MDO6581715.1 DUF2956 domain-containing protein [Photobacterium sp. 2_MG-2023]
MNKTTQSPSPETQAEAMQIARATQKPGQTKEQTKLIAQGIQKGIELYKKQQKAKARERDKFRKKQLKEKTAPDPTVQAQSEHTEVQKIVTQSPIAWILLVLSWAGFIGWHFIK